MHVLELSVHVLYMRNKRCNSNIYIFKIVKFKKSFVHYHLYGKISKYKIQYWVRPMVESNIEIIVTTYVYMQVVQLAKKIFIYIYMYNNVNNKKLTT